MRPLLFLSALALLAGCDASSPDLPVLSPGPVLPEFESAPRWSPDGRWLVYYDHGVRDYDPSSGSYQQDPARWGLWVASADGRSRRRVFTAPNATADWSPDGAMLVVEWRRLLYTLPLADSARGAGALVPIEGSTPGFAPAWQPGGDLVAYHSNWSCGSALEPMDPAGCGLFVVPAGGGTPRRLAGGADPTWDRAGRSLAFVGLGGELYRLALADTTADDGRAERLTSLNGAEPFASDTRSPSFTPDGDALVFESNGRTRVFEFDGGGVRQLISEVSRSPSVAPDGRIAYVGPGNRIWTSSPDGEGRTPLNVPRSQ